MKELIIVRHAKSSWDHPGLSDHDRPLNARGENAAPVVGEALAEREICPDVLISSTANRALTTARIIAGKIGYPEENIIQEGAIYGAGTGSLLRVIASIDEENKSAMLFGHNPGFHDLVDTLVGGYPIDRFVTCAVARVELDVDTWGEVGEGDGTLIEHLWPAMLIEGN